MENRIDLADYFNSLGFENGAEVGVADGRYSEILCQRIPGVRLYCIDPWDTYKGNNRGGRRSLQHSNYELAKQRLSKYKAVMIREKSMDALEHIPDRWLDFVFIDGNHDYQYVFDDIREWSKKVRSGGIISGHDYYQFKNSGVIEAVHDYTAHKDIKVNIIGDVRKHINDNNQPCFWWINP